MFCITSYQCHYGHYIFHYSLRVSFFLLRNGKHSYSAIQKFIMKFNVATTVAECIGRTYHACALQSFRQTTCCNRLDVHLCNISGNYHFQNQNHRFKNQNINFKIINSILIIQISILEHVHD